MITCLMTAGSNPLMATRAILCYQEQTWNNKELVIVDDGDHDLTPILEDIPEKEYRYFRYPSEKSVHAGKLINYGLDRANGDFIIHWNNNDWHHPDRIRLQMSVFEDGISISWLSGTLLHMDHPELVHHPYANLTRTGYPGSMIHRNNPAIRLPERGKKTEYHFISKWNNFEVKKANPELYWLIVRTMTGGYRERRHFLTGIMKDTGDIAWLAWLKLRGRNILSHPGFTLQDDARRSFQRYFQESQKLGLITSVG